MNYAPHCFFQTQHFLQLIMLFFDKNNSFHNEIHNFETFLAPGGASGGAKPSRAEPSSSRAKPSEAEPEGAPLGPRVKNFTPRGQP